MFTTVSLFCGAGGESQGLSQALEALGMQATATSYAVDYWPKAAAAHAANHPKVVTVHADITHLRATRRIHLLWASPPCVHYSRARNGPKSEAERSHINGVVHQFLRATYVDVFLMENVPEFTEGGPLDDKGMPIKARRGENFRQFIEELRGLGYHVEWRILCAADYGEHTTRRRFFLQAARDGYPIVWPEPTHCKTGEGLPPWKSAAAILDLDEPVPSIFTRKKPLATNTLRRIAAGIHRYVYNGAPFIISMRGTTAAQITASPAGLSEPLRTITSGGTHHALIAPFLRAYYGKSSGACLQRPLPTVTTHDRYGLVAATLIQTGYGERPGQSPRCLDISSPLGTVVAGGGKHALVAAFLVKHFTGVVGDDLRNPVPTITGTDHNGLVVTPLSIEGQHYVVDDIGMRMLTPRELARAMGFPDTYRWVTADGAPLTKKDQVKMIGNACSVRTVQALITSVLRVRREAWTCTRV